MFNLSEILNYEPISWHFYIKRFSLSPDDPLQAFSKLKFVFVALFRGP